MSLCAWLSEESRSRTHTGHPADQTQCRLQQRNQQHRRRTTLWETERVQNERAGPRGGRCIQSGIVKLIEGWRTPVDTRGPDKNAISDLQLAFSSYLEKTQARCGPVLLLLSLDWLHLNSWCRQMVTQSSNLSRSFDPSNDPSNGITIGSAIMTQLSQSCSSSGAKMRVTILNWWKPQICRLGFNTSTS